MRHLPACCVGVLLLLRFWLKWVFLCVMAALFLSATDLILR